MLVKASTVSATMTVTVTAIAAAPPRNSAVSAVVAKLKWEANPRQRCTATQATSAVSARASGPSSSHRVRPEIRSRPVTQARVMVVSPKEIPKVVGLRNDTGPCHAPSATSHAARWARPARTSAAPIR